MEKSQLALLLILFEFLLQININCSPVLIDEKHNLAISTYALGEKVLLEKKYTDAFKLFHQAANIYSQREQDSVDLEIKDTYRKKAIETLIMALKTSVQELRYCNNPKNAESLVIRIKEISAKLALLNTLIDTKIYTREENNILQIAGNRTMVLADQSQHTDFEVALKLCMHAIELYSNSGKEKEANKIRIRLSEVVTSKNIIDYEKLTIKDLERCFVLFRKTAELFLRGEAKFSELSKKQQCKAKQIMYLYNAIRISIKILSECGGEFELAEHVIQETKKIGDILAMYSLVGETSYYANQSKNLEIIGDQTVEIAERAATKSLGLVNMPETTIDQANRSTQTAFKLFTYAIELYSGPECDEETDDTQQKEKANNARIKATEFVLKIINEKKIDPKCRLSMAKSATQLYRELSDSEGEMTASVKIIELSTLIAKKEEESGGYGSASSIRKEALDIIKRLPRLLTEEFAYAEKALLLGAAESNFYRAGNADELTSLLLFEKTKGFYEALGMTSDVTIFGSNIADKYMKLSLGSEDDFLNIFFAIKAGDNYSNIYDYSSASNAYAYAIRLIEIHIAFIENKYNRAYLQRLQELGRDDKTYYRNQATKELLEELKKTTEEKKKTVDTSNNVVAKSFEPCPPTKRPKHVHVHSPADITQEPTFSST
ncbi:hypothetical protein KAW80_04415 [Candidatus Babeliales bacterium]|nr:hypothetical protein [Candidatus Babeliales bacterium]